jgi:predicted lipoprotein with Yx(FWY)xxD motif
VQQNTSWTGRVRRAGQWGRGRAALGPRWRHPRLLGSLAGAAVIALAPIVAACGSSYAGGAASAPSSAPAGVASSGHALKTTTINGVTVLTNARGFTLYSFAPDTPGTSKCSGPCAQLWPPVQGPVTAAPGVRGALGTITRSGGSTQVTYNGHPLYTYVADTAPGQAKGNDLNLSGGVWQEVAAAHAPAFNSGRR